MKFEQLIRGSKTRGKRVSYTGASAGAGFFYGSVGARGGGGEKAGGACFEVGGWA